MLTTRAAAAIAVLRIPGLTTGELPFPSAQVAATSAFITVPIGALLLIVARVFWRGRYLGLVAGYKEYGVADPKRMGKFVGAVVGALGVFLLAFPFVVRAFGPNAFIAFVFVVVGCGVSILIGGAYFERG